MFPNRLGDGKQWHFPFPSFHLTFHYSLYINITFARVVSDFGQQCRTVRGYFVTRGSVSEYLTELVCFYWLSSSVMYGNVERDSHSPRTILDFSFKVEHVYIYVFILLPIPRFCVSISYSSHISPLSNYYTHIYKTYRIVTSTKWATSVFLSVARQCGQICKWLSEKCIVVRFSFFHCSPSSRG